MINKDDCYKLSAPSNQHWMDQQTKRLIERAKKAISIAVRNKVQVHVCAIFVHHGFARA